MQFKKLSRFLFILESVKDSMQQLFFIKKGMKALPPDSRTGISVLMPFCQKQLKLLYSGREQPLLFDSSKTNETSFFPKLFIF
jgi:hypothetical protein